MPGLGLGQTACQQLQLAARGGIGLTRLGCRWARARVGSTRLTACSNTAAFTWPGRLIVWKHSIPFLRINDLR